MMDNRSKHFRKIIINLIAAINTAPLLDQQHPYHKPQRRYYQLVSHNAIINYAHISCKKLEVVGFLELKNERQQKGISFSSKIFEFSSHFHITSLLLSLIYFASSSSLFSGILQFSSLFSDPM